MKKKILTSTLITVVIALVLITSCFFVLLNIRDISNKKEILSTYNNIVIKSLDINKEVIDDIEIFDDKVRFTIINTLGNSLFDTVKIEDVNYLESEDVVNAFNKGQGNTIAFNKKEGRSYVYYSTKINDNTIIRSSISIGGLKEITKGYLKYYIIIIILVIIFSIQISKGLIKSIIDPIKEMEDVTNKIASGDYSKRVKIYSNDEIGSLARTFNEMSDQLQTEIKDSMDKNNKLEAILESMESGVIAVDNKFNIILANQYAKTIFALRDDILGKNLSQCILDYDINEFIKSKNSIEAKEIKILHPVEKIIRVKKAKIINYKNIPIGTVMTLQDITDLKRLENMRSEFVANVSHELKTPLTSIKGFSETLRFVEDSDTKNKFLDIIDKEAERLGNLINDILILSNIENNNKMNEEKFNIAEVIEDVINMVTPQAIKKNIIINFVDEGSKYLLGDSDKFFQMILNLVENAIKYSEAEKNITIRTYDEKEHVFIEVEDQGVGIPQDEVSRIFERFYVVDKSRAKKGTGLGLAIVKHIVKMFNGEIFVESKLGIGSKFIVKIKRNI
ncbi:HAMP domain-containing sensor histidine kinase [Clostridium isatidis]|uniref:histidine kinase n=1 Tax=Clostridium isatidis TaxID=182773 RepID=A0A343JBT1_9CLOT|nr:ATP-binding protein [Clostridium isatidis]ASW42989.1 PAS domain-containing sensor histidine kinase [Clostridium isatidis]